MSKKLFTLKNKRHLPKGLAWLFACLIKLIAWTYRVKVIDPHGNLSQLGTQAFIGTIWHNRFLFVALLFPRSVRERCSVLISRSRDGEYISTIVRFFGLGVVRGSSSRGGDQALRDLMHTVSEGQSIVLTVDGPRGPRYVPHEGAIYIARQCQTALLPISVNAPHKWELRSWDRLQIPVPFSRIQLVIGEPFLPPEEMSRPQAGEELKRRLLDITVD